MPNLGERHLVNVTNEIIKVRKVVSLAAQLLAAAIHGEDAVEVAKLLKELRKVK